MFAVIANNGKFYNGRAGDWASNLTDNKGEAFAYGRKEAAELKAAIFNQYTAVHGYTFTAVPLSIGE